MAATSDTPPDMSVHTIPVDTGYCRLDANEAFAGLTQQEKGYAHALGKADWEGAKICLLQCSAESVPIFALFQHVFAAQPVQDLVAAATKLGVSDEEMSQALMYVGSFYGNMGNYKSFGDTKFVPGVSVEVFGKILTCGAADKSVTAKLWSECSERMYSLPRRQRQMGLGASNGISTYFSANCDENDASIAGKFLDSIGLSAYNTRLFKDEDGSLCVRIASATADAGPDPVGKICTTHDFEGNKIRVVRGDYAPLMARVVAALKEAIPHAANDEQTHMLEKFASSFELGSIDDHKDGSRFWIRDTGPAVESYIGFIESYRDPSGVRGEWEGFVACVNREVSKKFGALVDSAESLLKLFPWPSCFEKDTFLRPDFTSLDVLSFGSSGVPAGINIPNYDDIRQSEGFKNVSLGNVLAASYGAGEKPVTFIHSSDQILFKKLKGPAFEVQVGIHELLGHGSGKLFHQGTSGAENLVSSQTLHPVTNTAITGPFYAPGATWDSTFGKIASTYEECRAECAGIFLCLEREVLHVFGHACEPDSLHDIMYINWLLMVRAGLVGLEFYTPSTKAWRQAHMQARYVILRVLLEAGQGLVSVEKITGADGKPDVTVKLNRELVKTVGRETIGNFLLKLQTYKSLGDVANGSDMYNSYSEVTEEMLAFREIVMARKEARKILVQPHMDKKNGSDDVELLEFESSPAGMIESFKARYPAEDKQLLDLYFAEKAAVTDK